MKGEKSRYPSPVLIDGTLREGEQSAGVFFTSREKKDLLLMMDEAGIDIADCGMPAVSRDEFRAIRSLASLPKKGIRVGASVRFRTEEIDLFKKTGATDCFIIVPVSDVHISSKFSMGRAEYSGLVERSIAHARDIAIPHIHIVFEDATRADHRFMAGLLSRLLPYGIEAVYNCDTIGVGTPDLMASITRLFHGAIDGARLKRHATGIGVHCHNDFGFALANTISAFESGAGYLTFTQNGIGERAGNAKFHELSMYLSKIMGVRTRCDLGMLCALSSKVELMSGIFMPPTEPVVGFNAFRHESGIHVSGLLRNRKVYEEHRPEDIGRRNEFVLGKHSGTAIIDDLLRKRFPGAEASPADKRRILDLVKAGRVSAGKAANRKMSAGIRRFCAESLGGLSEKDFDRIVREVLGL